MKLKRQEVYLPRQTSGADPFSFQATFLKRSSTSRRMAQGGTRDLLRQLCEVNFYGPPTIYR